MVDDSAIAPARMYTVHDRATALASPITVCSMETQHMVARLRCGALSAPSRADMDYGQIHLISADSNLTLQK